MKAGNAGLLAALAMAIGISVNAEATVVVLSNFENPPFITGGIGGQGGWMSFASGGVRSVVNTNPLDGAQSLQLSNTNNDIVLPTSAVSSYFDGLTISTLVQPGSGSQSYVGLFNNTAGANYAVLVDF